MRPLILLTVAVIACGAPAPPPSAQVGPVDAEAPTATATPSATPSTTASTAASTTPAATSSATAGASSELPPPQPSASGASSAPPPSKAGCVEDAKAKADCNKRGAGFHYGPQPYIRCSGVAPPPGEVEAAHARIRNAPCECVNEAAAAKRQHDCRLVPSAPPRPQNGL